MPPSRSHVPPRVGERVADELRERILGGRYGENLPKQEALMAEFAVSAPSIREAFRVLEAEGLIEVRRGNVGGATIKLPTANNAAYALGLALQAEGVRVAEVAATLWHIEPAVARLCAEREDRALEVVPRLEEAVRFVEDMADDAPGWEYTASIFHDRVAQLCGNGALRTVVASVSKLHHSQVDEWTDAHGWYASRAARAKVTKEHRRILALIKKGDGAGAARAMAGHLKHLLTPLLDEDEIVSVTLSRQARPRHRAGGQVAGD
jgi:GntR family transcriptional repressor for pyruvate dehydrogenase complex